MKKKFNFKPKKTDPSEGTMADKMEDVKAKRVKKSVKKKK